MKKLLLLLFSILISFNSYGAELKSLFGISLYESAEKYVSINFINSNKYKYSETNDDFYYLDITDKIKTKTPYANEYKIIIDNANRVHRVYGRSDLNNLDICQAIRKDIFSNLEDKYQIDFKFFQRNFPEFSTYFNSHMNRSGDEYRIQCRLWNSDSSTILQIIFDSEVLAKSIYEFYTSGL